MTATGPSAPEGFTRGSGTYDDAVRHNVAGSERLVMSLPDGEYRRVLDVGCGTGWTSAAMLRRFDVATIVGVDASEAMLERVGAPAEWTGWWAVNPRGVDEMDADLRAAGLEPLDVWMERRRRRTHPDAFMARTRSVAAHLLGNPPGGHSELDRRVERGLRDAAGPDGFVYDYCKLYAVARKPEG